MFYLLVAVIFILYFLICFYIGINGWVWLHKTFSFRNRKVYILLIAILSFSVFFERILPLKAFAYMGGTWLLIVGYCMILLPLVNIIYFLFKKRGIELLGGAVMIFFLFVFTFGTYHAWNPTIRTYDLSIDKLLPQEELTIIMISDLHLGNLVGINHLEKFVEIVNARKPDLILMPGDIIDDHIDPYLKHNMGDAMKKIKAPLGVYATSGNHDFYGNDLESLLDEMEKAGISMLTDEVASIQDQMYIIGRNDLTDVNRKSIEELVKSLDKDKPIIMLDHQPDEIDEASQNGVDLILSGHTHGGQVAPANLITGLIYENDWGYLQKENMHSIVSSGFGLWGTPFRIGTQAEVVEIKLKFK